MKPINFFKFHFLFFALSLAVVISMFVLLGVKGFDYGTDFKGGLEATVVITASADSDLDSETLREQLATSGLNTEVQEILTRENTFLIRFAISESDEAIAADSKTTQGSETDGAEPPTPPTDDTTPTTTTDETTTDDATKQTEPATPDVQIPFAVVPDDSTEATNETTLTPVTRLREALSKHYDETEFSLLQSHLVGSVLSAENRINAIWTSLVVLILIIAYLTLRFEFPFALAAISAVIYDVIVILAFVLLLGDELTILIIVAILTTFGYSVNDTIVLFDRVREETPAYTSGSYAGLVNLSINKVLGRTLITSLTTLVVVTSLYVSTTGDYRAFSLYLIIGLLSGTYSSIYIAPAFLFVWNKYVRRFLEPS